VKTLHDLSKLPVTSKNDLQLHNWDFLCVEKNRISEYCTTSGTMGMPVTIGLTEQDMERLAYNEYLSFVCAGSDPNDIYQLMLSLDRQFMAGIAYHAGIRRLGAGIVRVGPGNIAMQIDTIRRLGSTVLIAVPSFIVALIHYAREHHIPLNDTAVRKIICIGENIRQDDFSLNALGSQIVKSWNVELYSTYASTEKQTAFTECAFGRGGHHHPELLVFEVLDEQDQPLPAGQYGELAITTLGVEGMPLIRYKTGDICTYHDEPCACGRHSARISPIRGRRLQLIKYNGTTLYPQSIFNILNSIEEVKDYVIEVSKTDLETDQVLVHLAVTDLSSATDDKIKHLLQSALRVLPKINYLPAGEIMKMQVVEGQRKPSKLLDKR
jgi:phenylacetate-CoA ligase